MTIIKTFNAPRFCREYAIHILKTTTADPQEVNAILRQLDRGRMSISEYIKSVTKIYDNSERLCLTEE